MDKNQSIRVVAGKALTDYPNPDYIRKKLRHLYHKHGDSFLEFLLYELSHEALVLINLKAGKAAKWAQDNPSPPAAKTLGFSDKPASEEVNHG